MDRTERFYRIDQLLNERRSVPIHVFLHELEVSRATFKRDLEYLRDRLNAPITWDRASRGYRFQTAAQDAPAYALPGLWFNASEIHALLSMQHLLAEMQPGLLESHIAPLLSRIRMLLEGTEHSVSQIERRIRVLSVGARSVSPRYFEALSSALLSRRRLRIVHYSRARGEQTLREVSPQRLVHYRENWYLDAWCHLRRGLRSFGVDGIRKAIILNQRARNVPARRLDAELGSGYGIFAGRRTRRARLRFTPERARWVADEQWHPKQKGRFQKDGGYVLELPMSDHRELLMDILRHGPHVEVLAPASLRAAVIDAVHRTVRIYDSSA